MNSPTLDTLPPPYYPKTAMPKPESVDPKRLKITNDAATEATLIGFRCRQCGASVFGPATFCQACTSFDLEPSDLGRAGTLYSYTIVRIPPAGWPGPVPYILGQVQLPAGPQVLAEIIDCAPSELIIGMPLNLAIQTVPPPAVPNPSETQPPPKLVYKWRPSP